MKNSLVNLILRKGNNNILKKLDFFFLFVNV